MVTCFNCQQEIPNGTGFMFDLKQVGIFPEPDFPLPIHLFSKLVKRTWTGVHHVCDKCLEEE